MRIMRHGFTLVEIIFTIVIAGIVGIAGTQAILKVYENYMLQSAYNRVQLDSERVVSQIARYLEQAVFSSIVINSDSDDIAVRWYAKDMRAIEGKAIENRPADKFNGMNKPIFAGYIDLERSERNVVYAPNSALDNSIVDKKLYFTIVDKAHKIVAVENGDNSDELDNKITLEDSAELTEISDIAYVVESDEHAILRNIANEELVLKVDASSNYTIAKHVKRFNVWYEGGGSLVRLRLCLSDEALEKILDCKSVANKDKPMCKLGICKESVVLQ